MVERQDIDALLVGALYGELTPADEKRLAAHLESHPADKAVLADLTRAREIVRESRILQVQLEPPPSISALLLQEASRRAPKAEVEEGWFARFVRSFVSHPAMAAAATIVVVLGVVTVMTNRKGDHFASTEKRSAAVEESRLREAAPAIAAQGSAAPAGAIGEGATDTGAAIEEAAPDPAASDNYQVTLAEQERQQQTDRAGDGVRVNATKGGEPTPKPAAKSERIAKEDVGAIELRKQQPMPKDFDEGAAPAGNTTALSMADDTRGGNAGRAPSTGGAAPVPESVATNNAPRNYAPPPPPSPPTSNAPAKVARDERSNNDRTVDKARAATSDSNVADPQLAWARDQHAKVIAQVRAGNCTNAAGLAVSLENRAPSYYSQNVASDRAIKDCVTYINREREKEAEVRAAERARANKRNEPERAKPASTSKPEPTNR